MIVATTELCRMGATELAEVIRSGQASSQEVIEVQPRRGPAALEDRVGIITPIDPTIGERSQP